MQLKADATRRITWLEAAVPVGILGEYYYINPCDYVWDSVNISE